jgi:hypothetical protein
MERRALQIRLPKAAFAAMGFAMNMRSSKTAWWWAS